VAHCTTPQPVRETIVLFARDVGARLLQVIDCLVYPAPMIRSLVYRRVISQILAIVEGRLLDIAYAGVYLTHRFLLVSGLHPVSGAMFNEPTRSPEVGQGVQVGRMMRWRGRRSHRRGDAAR